MRVRHQKDSVGHALMLKMCKPRKLLKAEVVRMAGIPANSKKAVVDAARADLEESFGPFWHESPEDLTRLCLYCGRDVLAEHALSEALGPMTPVQLRIFQLVEKTNQTGVECDLEFAQLARDMMHVLKSEAEETLSRLTDGTITTVNQGARMISLAKDLGYHLPNTQKHIVADVLEDPHCPDLLRSVLQIKRDFGRSSVSKYDAFISRADPSDRRVRDHLRSFGAHTWRLASKGIQTQNFPKPDKGIKFKDVLEAMDIVRIGDPELFNMLYLDPAAMLSASLRPTIRAGEGKVFVCVDYASIEAVLTLWYAGDPGLQLIRDGLCIYRDLAGQIYGLDDPQSLPKSHEYRQHGKIGVLGSGFGMSGKKLKATAKKQWGLDLPLDLCNKIVAAYREKYQEVPATWKLFHQGFLRCVYDRTDVGLPSGARFKWGYPFVELVLPSGRSIYYFKPTIRMKRAPWGEDTPTVCYWAENSQSRKWELTKTYGGKTFENIVQGMAGDLMYDAWDRISVELPYLDIVMSVHDELLFLVDENRDVEKIKNIVCEMMCENPWWAPGLPIGVEAWIGKEYRK